MAAAPSTNLIAFLPWLRLRAEQQIGGVRFVTFRPDDGEVHPLLRDAAASIENILSGYVDLEGRPVGNCTIATIPDGGWNLLDAHFDQVNWAASLLFLASWAANEYFPQFSGRLSSTW